MNQPFKNMSEKSSLFFLGAIVVLLIFLAILSFKAGPFRSSFSVDEVLISQELDGSRKPIRIGNRIPSGVRQVCLWLKYSSAREGSYLEVSWFYQDEMVLSERVGLTAKDGVRAFYLLRDSGDALPTGDYKVTVSTAAKKWSETDFRIEQIKTK